jgi:hypothetical protein
MENLSRHTDLLCELETSLLRRGIMFYVFRVSLITYAKKQIFFLTNLLIHKGNCVNFQNVVITIKFSCT